MQTSCAQEVSSIRGDLYEALYQEINEERAVTPAGAVKSKFIVGCSRGFLSIFLRALCHSLKWLNQGRVKPQALIRGLAATISACVQEMQNHSLALASKLGNKRM